MKDDHKAWYNEAIEMSNYFGFAGMSAADVIKYLAIENEELKQEIEILLNKDTNND